MPEFRRIDLSTRTAGLNEPSHVVNEGTIEIALWRTRIIKVRSYDEQVFRCVHFPHPPSEIVKKYVLEMREVELHLGFFESTDHARD